MILLLLGRILWHLGERISHGLMGRPRLSKVLIPLVIQAMRLGGLMVMSCFVRYAFIRLLVWFGCSWDRKSFGCCLLIRRFRCLRLMSFGLMRVCFGLLSFSLFLFDSLGCLACCFWQESFLFFKNLRFCLSMDFERCLKVAFLLCELLLAFFSV